MKIIIVGAGAVGKYLAKLLTYESINVTIMDEDSSRMRDLDSYDLLSREGSPTSINDLKEIGVDGADLFVAVTPYESVNMTSCMIASSLGAKRTLSRIDNYEYLLPKNKEFFKKLGVDYLIYPEVLAAHEIIESLKTSWMRHFMSFCNEALLLVAVKVRGNSEIIGKKFNSGYFTHNRYRIVALKRMNQTIIPMGQDEIMSEDLVYFITSKKNIDFVRTQAGKSDYEIKDVMIMGGSRIAQKTVQELANNINVKILEKDREICYQLAEKLEDTLIINSDSYDIEVLKSEGIEQMDAFIAVSQNSEENMLSSLVAKRFGIKKTIAEVEDTDYLQLAESMDIGTVINKKMIAASYIHQLILDADVLDVRKLTSVDAEVLEFVAKPHSKITKNKVKNLRLPSNVNIGGIVRNGLGQVVDGDTQILPNDHVVVFCEASSIHKLAKLFD